MNKKEKYYNYVVNDLVSKTEIDHGKKRIKFPFYYNYISPDPSQYPHLFFSFISSSFSRFSKHVIERYGVHDEEMEIIWYQYKEKIQPLIK